MKKTIAGMMTLICILTIMFGNVKIRAEDAVSEPQNLYAQSAVLMDADSGRVLFGKDEKKIRPMASTTKIMTCILALEHMNERQVVSVSDYAVGQPKVRLGVKGKEEYYLKDLLYSLMLESHNDSAVVVAEGIAGSVEEFADMMNDKAKELGCLDTHFVTPNGLDASDEGGIHATTAADLARIMRYCIMESPKREEFLEITRTKSYSFTTLKGDRSFSCNNHNAFLDMMEGALTGKTGFTGEAGYCYVGALRRDGKTFIVALLACGWPNNKGYKWKDTRMLMEYGLNNYEYRNVWETYEPEEIIVKKGVDKDNIYAKEGAVKTALESKGQEVNVLLREDEEVTVNKELAKSMTAPVHKGEKVGELTYILEGNLLSGYDIVTCEEIEVRDFLWCFRTLLKSICM